MRILGIVCFAKENLNATKPHSFQILVPNGVNNKTNAKSWNGRND